VSFVIASWWCCTACLMLIRAQNAACCVLRAACGGAPGWAVGTAGTDGQLGANGVPVKLVAAAYGPYFAIRSHSTSRRRSRSTNLAPRKGQRTFLGPKPTVPASTCRRMTADAFAKVSLLRPFPQLLSLHRAPPPLESIISVHACDTVASFH
jgi:hypothetical protein